jgi:hypothetical protein
MVLDSVVDPGWIPCDVFMQLSYCDNSPSTQFGGIPYRPRGLPWPTFRPTGQPMQFVAQFRFDRAKPQFSHLPGDLLLFFIAELSALASNLPEEAYRFEWFELPFQRETSPQPETWNGHTGLSYSTFDAGSESALTAANAFLQQYVPDWTPRPYLAPHLIRFPGIKTGGAPPFRDPRIAIPADSYLLSMCTSGPGPVEEPYPWIDRPTPTSLAEATKWLFDPLVSDRDCINARDGFLLNLHYADAMFYPEVMFS